VGFKEDLLRLSNQISDRREHIINEEMTKTSLVMPFLQTLGYDVFDPMDVRPEWVSSFGGAKNARIDYAVFKDGNPIMFIEAKPIEDSLKGHFSQLRAYFNATPTVRIAIITNGIIYRFYSDLNMAHLMDDCPFWEADISSLSDEDMDVLSSFRHDEFDIQKILSFAEALTYTNNITLNLEGLLREPSDEFIRFILANDKSTFKVTSITSAVIDKFRPIVKKSISQALMNLVQKGLAASAGTTGGLSVASDTYHKSKIVTTESELQAFAIIKDLLMREGRDADLLQHKDTSAYFGIYIKNPSHWIVRLNLDAARKTVTTNLAVEKVQELVPGHEVAEANKGIGISRVFIDSVEGISELGALILAAYDEA